MNFLNLVYTVYSTYVHNICTLTYIIDYFLTL